MTQIVNPFMYVADHDEARPESNAQLFFGLPGTDPTIATNQKLVRGVQESGAVVSLPQPVRTTTGGIPVFSGSPVVLDVSGNFSFTVLNSLGAQQYHVPTVDNPEDGSSGFSGVVVIENNTLTVAQTTVVLTNVGANESVFYLHTNISDQGFLKKDTDYTVTNSTTIELTQSYNAGDIVVGRQNDPTGQLIPVVKDAAALLVFVNLTTAQAAAVAGDLVVGNTVTLNGNPTDGDGLGGDKYKVITTAQTNDGVNYLDLNGTLQLELQNNLYRFQNYSEKIAVAPVASGVLTLNLNNGVIQTVTLTENISDVTFVNYNPNAIYASTVTLRITQDGTGGRGVTWPALIKWPGGTVPTVSSGANNVDEYIFTTFDAGVTWSGKTAGQVIS